MAARNWCFTLNNASFNAPTTDSAPEVRYMVWQEEKGLEGTTHLQGYVELVKPMRMQAVKRVLGINGAHLETRKGTRDQARDYCMKEETRVSGPWEYGEWSSSGQGRRSDLISACKILEDSGLPTLIASHPEVFVKYHRGLQALQFYKDKERSQKLRTVRTYVIWGATGVGKTHAAMVMDCPKFKLDMSANGSTLWWDGYQSEPVLVVDDFYGWVPFGKLLNLLDIYPLRLDVKGAHAWAAWEVIIITSNKPPEDWYHQLTENQKAALERRLTQVYYVTDRSEVPDLSLFLNKV